MARTLVITGLTLLAAGILIWLFPGIMKYPGRLPGDFHFRRGNFSLYFPLTSGLILSLILSLLFRLLSR